MNTKAKGITLIALIITIIVMLILVGVTVSVALNGGLFKTAKNAAQRTDKSRIEEEMTAVVAGFMNENLLADANIKNLKTELSKIKGITPVEVESFPLTVKDENGNEWTIDEYGKINYIEPLVERIISADDPEAEYWKTDGQGTIIYYEVPEGIEPPETLIVPSQIGDEKITKIGDYALWGVRLQRDENGFMITETDEDNGEEYPIFLDELNEDGYPISPSATTAKVKNIIIPKEMEEIGDYAFAFNSSLISLNISSNSVGNAAFGACPSLENVTLKIGDSIGEYILSECPSLKNVNITAKELNVTKKMFDESNNLANVTLKAETIIIDGPSWYPHVPGAFTESLALRSVILEAEVIELDYDAFYGCENLKTISLKGTRSIIIGESAFYGCTSIKEIYIPETVDTLGAWAFGYWTNEQTIYMGKTEEPPTVSDYSGPGWCEHWRDGNCDANVIWGK